MAANTVIIGAGPAGLTAAYELRKRGHSASVLEASTQVGGLSRTENYRGYRFDIGGHRFFSKVPLINDLWQEILGEEFLLRPRLSRIYYNQHFFDYPLKPLNALVGLARLSLCSLASAIFGHNAPRPMTKKPSRTGCPTGLDIGSIASFSRRTLRRFGASRATRYQPIGRLSASRTSL